MKLENKTKAELIKELKLLRKHIKAYIRKEINDELQYNLLRFKDGERTKRRKKELMAYYKNKGLL